MLKCWEIIQCGFKIWVFNQFWQIGNKRHSRHHIPSPWVQTHNSQEELRHIGRLRWIHFQIIFLFNFRNIAKLRDNSMWIQDSSRQSLLTKRAQKAFSSLWVQTHNSQEELRHSGRLRWIYFQIIWNDTITYLITCPLIWKVERYYFFSLKSFSTKGIFVITFRPRDSRHTISRKN